MSSLAAAPDAGDQADRLRAIRERERNVIVEASAGTGKTKLVVDRIVELVAPLDGARGIPLSRLAAITFTRKAAGELRVRTRQQILDELARAEHGTPRCQLLTQALAALDTAHLGTIHSFADQILRKWPAEARLDPGYELIDDSDPLVDECFELLLEASDDGRLVDLVADTVPSERAVEAIETVRVAQRAGLERTSRETEHWTYHGLDAFVAGLILHRDIDALDPAALPFDRERLGRFGHGLDELVRSLADTTRGSRWLKRLGVRVVELLAEEDPALIYRELVRTAERGPLGRPSNAPKKGEHFGGDDAGWNAWRAFDGDDRKKSVRASPLRDDLLAPLRSWLGRRLVRLRPVILALYEKVKARHRVVDHVDLLLRLRNLLRDDSEVRAGARQLFDHILIDEFQDTDPLQLDVVRLLCGLDGGGGFRPGVLTIVGDPKQSIYRFRRADLASYQRALADLRQSPHLEVRLTTTFRSEPSLVDWLNTRFVDILGGPRSSEARAESDVTYFPLRSGRPAGISSTVHSVAVDLPAGATVDIVRSIEGRAMARYVRWLVEVQQASIVDPLTRQHRALRYGDVGVLAISTRNLPALFEAFDGEGVPYAARGGVLFVGDPLHRRFLLGLCALADRNDGVALAALLRPPFFAVDLSDLARTNRDDPADRAASARAIVAELRRRRFERGPGTTARGLLEETGFGRTIALGPNGRQRLAGLRELCFQVELRALEGNLDFDATVEQMRPWIERPVGLDRPHPVGDDTVRVLTVHQAKGLEFPAVLLWDARAGWFEQASHAPWTVEREGRGWEINLDGLKWEEPRGMELAKREKLMREAERKRLVYVAATRARDLLIVPDVGPREDRWILGRLLGQQPHPSVLEHPRHSDSAPAPWFEAGLLPPDGQARGVTTDDEALRGQWHLRAGAATQQQLRPRAFSDAESSRTLWGKRGRFGTVFGETVHLAIGLVLKERTSPADAVARAATRTGLIAHLANARSDVERAVAALAALGLGDASAMQLEYPISGNAGSDELLSGYVDLLVPHGDELLLIDFKTDQPPAIGEAIHARYIAQVQGYARVLRVGLAVPVRAGLLYTADGVVRWLDAPTAI